MWETILTILKIALVGLCGVGIYYLVLYSYFFWNLSEAICSVVSLVIGFITKPFKNLWDKLKDGLSSIMPSFDNLPISRFADNHPTFGTGRSIRFFIFGVIFIAAITGISMANNTFGELLEKVATMFPFFFIVDILAKDAEFTLVGLISTGVSAMIMGSLFGFCLQGYERKGHFLRWLIAIPYYIVTTILGCYLGYLLSGVWEYIAKTGIALFNTMKNSFSDPSGLLGFLGGILALAALIVISYLGIVLLLTAIREYIETFCYGLLGFGIFIVFAIVSFIIGGQAFFDTELFRTLALILALFGIFGVDFIRVNKVELLHTDKF